MSFGSGRRLAIPWSAAAWLVACGPSPPQVGDTTATEGPPAVECGIDPGMETTVVVEEIARGAALGMAGARVAADSEGGSVLIGVDPASEVPATVVQARDVSGAVRWSDAELGARGRGADPLGVAIDGAGFIHVLVREIVLIVRGENSATFDARVAVLRYGPDGSHKWRWEREHPPVERWQTYRPGGSLAIDGDSIAVLVVSDGEPVTRIGLDRFGNVVDERALETPFEGSSLHQQWSLGTEGRTAVAASVDDGMGNHPLWVGAFGPDGAVIWSDAFGSIDDRPLAVLAEPGGGAFAVWKTRFADRTDQTMRRYGSDGAVAWTKPLVPAAVDSGVTAGVLDCAGNIVLTGGVEMPAGPELEWAMRSDLWVAAFDPDGNERWTQTVEFGAPYSYGSGSAVAVALDGQVWVAGSFLGDDGSAYEAWFGRAASLLP